MSDQTNRSADQTTRRNFFLTMGKVAAGLAAVIAGESFATGSAFAASIAQNKSAIVPNSLPLYCCTGTACADLCPSGSSIKYQWQCCSGPDTIECNDCLTSSGAYVCTWAERFTIGNC